MVEMITMPSAAAPTALSVGIFFALSSALSFGMLVFFDGWPELPSTHRAVSLDGELLDTDKRGPNGCDVAARGPRDSGASVVSFGGRRSAAG